MKLLDFSKIKTYSIKQRRNKVARQEYAQKVKTGEGFKKFLEGLPKQLKAMELDALVTIWAETLKKEKPVIAMCGAHVLKVGLGPLLIQALEEKWITALAFNGAGAIHDFELAYQGGTSEDVSAGLADGTFGMAEETGRFFNEAAQKAKKDGLGLGQSLGELISCWGCEFLEDSVVYQGWKLGVPITIHVAIGTDIVHQHPTADGSAIGTASFRDFQLLATVISSMKGSGLVLNIGSAVVLPEVFLKALTIARNLCEGVEGFTTANFDMLPQYRSRVNVVERPSPGRGFQFFGHHELMIPLVFRALAEKLG